MLPLRREVTFLHLIMAGSTSDVVRSPVLAPPPPLPFLSRWHAAKRAGLFSAGALALIMLAGVIQQRAIPMLPCGFKTLSGLPCPACGSTRAFATLATGEVGHAFVLNPLAVGSVLVIFLALLMTCLDAALTSGRVATKLAGAWSPRMWGWLAGLLVVANWGYLVVEGR